MRHFLALLAIVLAAGAGAAASQPAAEPDSLSLKKGDLVRVTIAGITTVCIIEEIQPGLLSLESWETTALQRVRIADISSLEIRAPRSPAAGAGRGALLGAVGGLLVGLIAGQIATETDDASEGDFLELTIAAYGFYGFSLGAFIGVFLGGTFPGEHWKKIPLDARLDAGASSNGTIGVGIAIPIGGS